MLIKLELDLSPQQLIAVGIALGGKPMVLDTPLTRGAAETDRTIVDAFDKYWDRKVSVGAADDHCSAEYNRAFTEWFNDGCPTLVPPEQQPSSPAADPDKAPATYFEAISGATDSDADEINGEQQPASPAADAFAADAEVQIPATEVLHAQQVGRAETNTQPTTSAIDLAKGTNGQMIPWDARIHGKAKNKNADGSWRLLQGVDRDTFVPQVEAELVSALTAPKPAEGATVPSPEQAPTTQQSPAAVTTTAPAAAPSVPNPPAQGHPHQGVYQEEPATKPTTFPELLPLVTAAKAAGTLSDKTIADTCAELGLASFGLIATRPDLIPQAAELLGV